MAETYYNDNTLLSSGKYHGKRIYEVPVGYLITAAGTIDFPDKNLHIFARENLDRLKRIQVGSETFQKPRDPIPCTKFAYVSKKEARSALNMIKDKEGGNKKPIRSYYCDNCNSWHLTSLPLEEWKELKKHLAIIGKNH